MAVAFTRTREQLANLVLGKLGVLAGGTSAVTADADVVYEAIDLRLKEMHRLGTFWRKVTNVPVTFSLTSGLASASAGAGDILFPLTMSILNGSTDEPVKIIGIREYAEIPDKDTAGQPTEALWKGGTEFVFWPVPSADGTAKLTYEKIADDTQSAGAADVDVAMIRWLGDILKYDLGDQFGKSEQTMLRFKAEAETAERNIRKLTVQHVDYSTVQVDDYDYRPSRNKTDWNTG